MSFGVSAGDFIAVGKLIKDIASCLQDIGGSKVDYQELLRELDCLQQALKHLDRLKSDADSTNISSIKYAALSCRRPLETFLQKIQKYDQSLGIWGKEGVIKSTADKLRWGLGRKEEVRKLQSYLNIHVGTINILLAEHGLEKMDLASDKAAAEQLHIRERLEDTRSIIKRIGDSLSMQALVIQNTHSLLSRLFETVAGELKTTWRSLGDMVAKACVCTQQTYGLVLEIKTTLARPDGRFSHFQAPLIVEDALGFKFPVPSEYDYDLLDAVVRRKFIAGPGSLEVRAGNYEYFQTQNSRNLLSDTSRFLPGMAITMAIVIAQPTSTDAVCPMPKCTSMQTIDSPGGGRICCACGVWFTPTMKKPNSLRDLLSAAIALSESETGEGDCLGNERARKKPKLLHNENDVSVFKNIRLAEDNERLDDSLISTNSSETYNSKRAANEDEESTQAMEDTTRKLSFKGTYTVKGSRLNSSNSSYEYQLADNNGELYRDGAWIPEKLSRLAGDEGAHAPTQLANDPTPLMSPLEYQALDPPVNVQLEPIEMIDHSIMSTSDEPMEGSGYHSSVYDKTRPLEYNDAIAYIQKIKDRFLSQPSVYRQILEILQLYQRENISVQDVYLQIVDLLKSEPDLIEGFKQFLPKSSQQERAKSSGLISAYMNKIRDRFQSQPYIYGRFLEILQWFQRDNKPSREFFPQIIDLFISQPDLLEEFKQYFILKSDQAAWANALDSAHALDLHSNVSNMPDLEDSISTDMVFFHGIVEEHYPTQKKVLDYYIGILGKKASSVALSNIEFYGQIKGLYALHGDILEEFNKHFWPTVASMSGIEGILTTESVDRKRKRERDSY